MGKYRSLGTLFNRVFRNDLNANFDAVASDIQAAKAEALANVDAAKSEALENVNAQKKRVDDLVAGAAQPSEVVDARGGKALLKDRLDAVDVSLADSVKQSYEKLRSVTVPFNYDGAVFSFVDDDGSGAFLTNLKPTFDNKGVKVTLGIVSTFVGTSGYMTVDQLKQLQSEGFEVASHSKTHTSSVFRDDLANVADISIETEYKDSQKFLKDNGFNGYDIFVYPYGGFTTDSVRFKTLAKKYYRYGVNAVGGKHNPTPCDNMYLNRVFIDSTQDFTTVIKPLIDNAVTNKGWLIFGSHSWDTAHVNGSYLAQIIDYIQTLGAPILPIGEAAKYKGNVLSVGEFTSLTGRLFVANNGSLINDNPFFSEVYDTSVDMTRDIAKFKKGLTITPITGSKDTVTGVGGVLSTYIATAPDGTTAPDFCYQTFTPYNTNTTYMRKWITASIAWGTWEKASVGQSVDSSLATNLSSYTLSSSLRNNVTKTGDIVTGTVTIENAAMTGNLAVNDEIATFGVGLAPIKPLYVNVMVIKGSGSMVQTFAAIQNLSSKTRIISQGAINTGDIRRIVVNFSYNCAAS